MLARIKEGGGRDKSVEHQNNSDCRNPKDRPTSSQRVGTGGEESLSQSRRENTFAQWEIINGFLPTNDQSDRKVNNRNRKGRESPHLEKESMKRKAG